MNRLSIVKGDIVKAKTDAIVNAANTSLLGGGGVDGAIHKAAGPMLLEECKKFNGCPTGEARITPGFKLNAKYVIHTPGPIWRGGNKGEPELLASCYRNSLSLAYENGAKSIAFPSISTGVYRFPVEEASKIALREIASFLSEHDDFEKVAIVCFDESTFKTYKNALKEFETKQ
ncbi:O-acetyl-ADP-ribose deacetylase [Lachnospiraceae bacterium NSJ-143]|nr:O-acetyl-ADP-ribose deacetylase [Lachnospiraceae bacterium NSJ-143]